MFLNIGNTIREGFFGLCLSLDGIIYSLIGSAYKIFVALASARILSSEMFTSIANKVYIIIGVLMLFVLAYALLRGIINPDNSSKGNVSAPNIIKSVITAVLGLALTPVIFNLLYQAQGVFIENDVLARIVFRDVDDSLPAGTFNTETYDADGNQAGNVSLSYDEVEYNKAVKSVGGAFTATEIWKAFFRPVPGSGSKPEDIKAVDGESFVHLRVAAVIGASIIAAALCVASGFSLLPAAAIVFGSALAANAGANAAGDIIDLNADHITLQAAYNYSASGKDNGFDLYSCFLRNFTGYDADGDEVELEQRVSYLWGISGIAGIFALYAFVSFAIDMAIRSVKLAYYQIIAPIPLILQVLPNFKSNFSKYVKSVLSTYAEVFIRISVVYLVVYLACHVADNSLFNSDSLSSFNLSGSEGAIATAILLLGLVTFARQAPKIISDTFGIQSGSMSLGITKKLADGGGLIAAAAVGAGATGMVRNGVHAVSNVRNASGFRNKAAAAGRGLLSTAAGGLSGVVRGGYGARNAKSFGDVRKAASDAANTVTDRRDKREQYAQEHPGGIGAVMRAHVSDAGSAVANWAVGSVDTSYYDNRIKLDESMAKFKGDLENSTARDTYVLNQQRRIDDLARMNAMDYAYIDAVEKRADESMKADATMKAKELAFRAKAAGETDAAYEAAFNTWFASSSANASRFNTEFNTQYTALKSQKDSYLDRIKNDSNDSLYLDRSNFVLDANSAEYKNAEAKLAQERNEADLLMKSIKSDAVQRALAQAAATGVDNDTSRIYKKFFDANQSELRKYSNVEFGDTGGTLEDYIVSNFGRDALNGTVDMSMLLANNDYRFDVEVTGPGGAVTNDTIYYNHADERYYDSTGAAVDINNPNYKINLVTSGDYDSTTRSFSQRNVKSNTGAFKDVAQADQTRVSNDTNYKAAQRRKRQQQSNK